MTVEKLSHNTMLTKPKVLEALGELMEQGRVVVIDDEWTLTNTKKKGSTNVTPSPTKKAPAKKAALARKIPASKGVPAKKAAPAKKALAAKKAPVKKTVAPKTVPVKAVAPKSIAATNGAKKHARVAERDDKVLAIITASKKVGITDVEIAEAIAAPLGIAYHSIRRLKDEGKIESSKGENGVTRRYAV
jgi:hypothetical protein